jgi:hypothetical protein
MLYKSKKACGVQRHATDNTVTCEGVICMARHACTKTQGRQDVSVCVRDDHGERHVFWRTFHILVLLSRF